MRRALFTLSMVLFVAGSASAQSEQEIIDNLIFLKGSNAIANSICKDGALACSPKDVVKQRFACARAGFEARPSECGSFAAECFSACQ